MEKLIRALRCFASGKEKDFTCPEDCPYTSLNEVSKGSLYPPDTTIDGVDYQIDCDVDRMALDAADALEKVEKFQWVPVKVRPTTEKDEIDMREYHRFLDFHLPDDGERILVSRNGYVDVDENVMCEGDCYLDSWGDWADVDAWMPLPEPYKKEEE